MESIDLAPQTRIIYQQFILDLRREMLALAEEEARKVLSKITGITGTSITPTSIPDLVGDVTGNIITTTVAKVTGVDIDASSPTDGDALTYDLGQNKYVPFQSLPNQIILELVNHTGASVIAGDVVAINNGGDPGAFYLQTDYRGASWPLPGVALETITNNSTGKVCISGYIPIINLDADQNGYNLIMFSSTAKLGTVTNLVRSGVFGQVSDAGQNPPAVLFGFPVQSDGSSIVLQNLNNQTEDVIVQGTIVRLVPGSTGYIEPVSEANFNDDIIGVAQDNIPPFSASDGNGLIVFGGYTGWVNTDSTGFSGDYIKASLTPGLVTPTTVFEPGVFGRLLSGNIGPSTLSAFIWNPPLKSMNYVHTQVSALTTWTVNHNLGKFPSVSIVDSGGNEVYADINHVNSNQLTITFSVASSGVAYCN